jgi:hypothetical protein
MASTSETGHSKNVANFESLIVICTSLGSRYNPPKPQLAISNLNSLLVTSQNALSDMYTQKAAIFQAMLARREETEVLHKRVVKVINFLEVVDIPIDTLKQAKVLRNKILGRFPKKNSQSAVTETQQENQPTNTNSNGNGSDGAANGNTNPNLDQEVTPNTISTSQQSFDKQLEHFERLIQLLATEPNYNPNESDLTLASLNGILASLRQIDSTLKNKYVTYKGVMDQRDQILYKEEIGLVDISRDIKLYLKAILGNTSNEFKQSTRFKFTSPK